MENSNRLNRVAQILKRPETDANAFCQVEVLGLNRTQHRLRSSGRHADATAGETADTKVSQMNNRGLLADAANNPICGDNRQHFLQVRIVARIV